MAHYEVEIGEDETSSVCACCGRASSSGHGFVYKNGDAYAIYWAAWSTLHSGKKVSFALGIGEWDDDATADDRAWFGLDVFATTDRYLLRVVDPKDSPLHDIESLGRMMSRSAGIKHPLRGEVFAIMERVLEHHPAVRRYLSLPEPFLPRR